MKNCSDFPQIFAGLVVAPGQFGLVGVTNYFPKLFCGFLIFFRGFIMGFPSRFFHQYLCRVGKLHLVDLAGSERQSKTGASGTRD